MKEITFRFSNPVLVAGKLLLDVETKSNEPLKIFGINLRFLYDTRIFKPALTTNTNFKIILPSGYKLGASWNANSPTGWGLFGSTGAITYINTAVELTNPSKAISISDWTKVLQLQFTPKLPLIGEQCPSFIWDKKPDPRMGGYMTGSDGVTCAEYLGTKNLEMLSGPTLEYPVHMNWTPNWSIKYPFGSPSRDNCFVV